MLLITLLFLCATTHAQLLATNGSLQPSILMEDYTTFQNRYSANQVRKRSVLAVQCHLANFLLQCSQYHNQTWAYTCCHPLPAGATVDPGCLVAPVDGDICWEGQENCECEAGLDERDVFEYYDEELRVWLSLVA